MQYWVKVGDIRINLGLTLHVLQNDTYINIYRYVYTHSLVYTNIFFYSVIKKDRESMTPHKQ